MEKRKEVEQMPRLLIKLGKDFCSNTWEIVLGNKTHNWAIECMEPFELTHPYPGAVLGKKDIEILIQFLQQTLEEEENEQSDLERLEKCDSE